jgi:putative ABC transport system substrate-binding protein
MRRRKFMTLSAGAAAASLSAWPLAARAQQRAMHVIGLLNGQATGANQLGAFRQGLAEAGFVEGRNLAIVYRSAEGNSARLPVLAAELVGLQVAVIAAVGGDNSVFSAKAATATIPIVFTTAGDPVATGIVASLNRPGGNVTGATGLGGLLGPKQIGLLRDLVPRLATIGLLVSPANPMSPSIARDVQAAAQSVGLKVLVAEANNERDLDDAFAHLNGQRVDALVLASGAFFNRYVDRLVALAARHAIPTIFANRDFAADGGMMSYGADLKDAYHQAGIYTARILKGDKPADLPVTQPTRFELVINLKTVKSLGLTVPPGLLAIADEVIE